MSERTASEFRTARPPWMKLYWRVTLGLGRADDLGIYTLMMGLAWMRGDATLPSELGQLKEEFKTAPAKAARPYV